MKKKNPNYFGIRRIKTRGKISHLLLSHLLQPYLCQVNQKFNLNNMKLQTAQPCLHLLSVTRSTEAQGWFPCSGATSCLNHLQSLELYL